MNRRGMASLAAIFLAAVVSAAVIQMASSARAGERRANERVLEARARARLLSGAIKDRNALVDDELVTAWEGTEKIGDSTLLVRVTWKRLGGAWRAATWTEVRAWPMR